jgi:hypothetical protein
MHRFRDQKVRLISSSKNPCKSKIAGHSQEGKDPIHPYYLSPTIFFLAKKRLEIFAQESKIVQVSMQTQVSLS